MQPEGCSPNAAGSFRFEQPVATEPAHVDTGLVLQQRDAGDFLACHGKHTFG